MLNAPTLIPELYNDCIINGFLSPLYISLAMVIICWISFLVGTSFGLCIICGVYSLPMSSLFLFWTKQWYLSKAHLITFKVDAPTFFLSLKWLRYVYRSTFVMFNGSLALKFWNRITSWWYLIFVWSLSGRSRNNVFRAF